VPNRNPPVGDCLPPAAVEIARLYRIDASVDVTDGRFSFGIAGR
jgi:hypothetical protein